MRRRLFLLAPAAARLLRAADAAREVFELFASLATALGASEAAPFREALDPAMPDYQKLVNYIGALTAGFDIVCSIDVLSNQGDDRARAVDLDWLLQLTARGSPVARRRERVKCRLERRGKKWKITSLDPVAFFAPPKAG